MAVNQLNRSFFLIDDTEHGWGITPYFSFFVQIDTDGHRTDYLRFMEVAVLGIVTIFGLLSNTAICIPILVMRELRGSKNYFIISLSLASVVFFSAGVFIMPGRLYDNWTSGQFSCQFTYYIFALSGIVSMWTQAWMSIDRHKAIAAQRPMKGWIVLVGCIAIWLVNMGALFPMFHYARTHQVLGADIANNEDKMERSSASQNETDIETTKSLSEPKYICTVGMPHSEHFRLSYLMFSYIAVLGFLLPLLITITCYVRILLTIHSIHGNLNTHDSYIVCKADQRRSLKLIKRESTSALTSSSLGTTSNASLRERRKMSRSASSTPCSRRPASKRRNQRAVTLLLLLMFLFFSAWVPIFVAMTAVQLQHDSQHPTIHSGCFFWSIVIAYANACLNPFLYGSVFRNLKKVLKAGGCVKDRRAARSAAPMVSCPQGNSTADSSLEENVAL